MYRYCAFLPRPGRERAAAPLIAACAARLARMTPAYAPVFEGPSLTVLEAREGGTRARACALGAGGVALGTLFRAGTATPVADPTDTEAQTLAHHGPEAMLRLFWGRYVAFLLRPGGVAVLRDPTGGLDCFYATRPHFHMVFSDAADMAALGVLPLEIDWQHVARHLQFPAREIPGTGLAKVHALRGGEALHVGRTGAAVQPCWRPETLWQPARLPASPDAAAEALRAAVLQAVRGWSAVYGRILLALSGGLDSAVVLAALDGALSPDDVLCLNYNSGTADSDERAYARQAAAHFRADLMELDERPNMVRLGDVARVRFSAQPMMVLAQLARGRREANLARAFEAAALFDGAGGDEVFGSLLSFASATDYLWTQGLDRGFFVAAHEAARLGRVSVWQVMRRARAAVRTRSTALPLPPMDEAFHAHLAAVFPCLEPDLAQTLARPLPTDVPPGKRMQIEATSFCNRLWYPTVPEHHVETVHPLMSQPVLEAIYSLPTPLFCLGGRERGLARHAFRDRVPPDILRRQTKGGINNFTDQIVIHNARFLRGYFLDGLLVHHGLLDRAAVEEAFRTEGHQSRLMRTTLLSALGAEGWVRQWTSARRNQPRPAA